MCVCVFMTAPLCRFIYFEYHNIGLWATTATLRRQVERMDGYGFDCYLTGYSGLWRLTGCWDDRYEFKSLSRVVCAARASAARWALEGLDVKHYAELYKRSSA